MPALRLQTPALAALLALSACGPAGEITGNLATEGTDAGLNLREEPFDGGMRRRLYDGGPGSADCPSPTLESIRERTLLTKCANSGCHGADNPAEELDLTLPLEALSARLKEASHQSVTGIPLIKAGAYGSSYLYLKVFLATPTAGEQMPPPPNPPLDACTLDAIKEWIGAGAPDR